MRMSVRVVMVLRDKTEDLEAGSRSAKVRHQPPHTPGTWERPLLPLVHTALCALTGGGRRFRRAEAGGPGWATRVGASPVMARLLARLPGLKPHHGRAD